MEVSLRKFFERSRDGRAVPKAIEQGLQQGEDLGLPTEQLAKMPKAERARRLQQLGKIYTFSDLGSTTQVSEVEISAESGISSDRVTAFLDAFSMPFGQSGISALGTEVQRARERPLINDGEGNYLLVSHLALFWALRPALERCLKDAGDSWHRFRRRRSALVESSALRYLQDAMPGSVAYESVSFELEKEGLKNRYEIDGLLVCDTIMLIVEGKSASLTPAGRRGAPARVEKHLKEILVKAAEQAERARKALDQGEIRFFSSDGVEIALPKQISEIFPIVVTLEDLSDVTTMIWELGEAGLLPAEIPTPWALSLFELELICDLNEYTAMLIHFLRRRARLNVLRCVHASDELDWWMYYLERGLYFERSLEGPDAPRGISLMSMTDPLDAYYLWCRGDRTKPAKKPRQKLQRDLRALLHCLHERALPGHVEASVALLEMDDRGRRELTRGFRRIREMTETDGQFHDMSMLVGRDGSLGITFMAGPGSDLNALERRLGLYSMAKKHQSRLRRWVSFGWCADTPGLLDLVGLIVGDWHPDESLDHLLEEMELAPSRPLNQSDPNPNFRLPRTALRPPPKVKRR